MIGTESGPGLGPGQDHCDRDDRSHCLSIYKWVKCVYA